MLCPSLLSSVNVTKAQKTDSSQPYRGISWYRSFRRPRERTPRYQTIPRYGLIPRYSLAGLPQTAVSTDTAVWPYIA
eukprot:12168024-Karenia_brevis.AAC.1